MSGYCTTVMVNGHLSSRDLLKFARLCSWIGIVCLLQFVQTPEQTPGIGANVQEGKERRAY